MSTITRTVNLVKSVSLQNRSLWQWINMMFNIVDEERRKVVGPDRSCAEWVLRNGGAVKWSNEKELLKDYNKLPKDDVKLTLVEIDASNSSIMHYGFPHLKGCSSITKIILHECAYLQDLALKDLVYVKSSLLHLQVSSCRNITETGLEHLKDLAKLQSLLMYDLPYVTDKSKIVEVLKKSLPKCNVEFK